MHLHISGIAKFLKGSSPGIEYQFRGKPPLSAVVKDGFIPIGCVRRKTRSYSWEIKAPSWNEHHVVGTEDWLVPERGLQGQVRFFRWLWVLDLGPLEQVCR